MLRNQENQIQDSERFARPISVQMMFPQF